jgi:hypothetical protein
VRESRLALALKALLYALAFALYLGALSSAAGVASAIACSWLAMALAAVAHRSRLRLPVGIVLGLGALAASFVLGECAVGARPVAGAFGVRASFLASELVGFGLAALAVTFVLRLLSAARPTLALLEVVFVAGAAVAVFADHRHRMLNRPRFFSDWAWTLGVDPGTVLVVVGIVATVAATFLFLRAQPLSKLVTTLVLLLLVGAVFFVLRARRLEPPQPLDALGLSGKAEDSGEQGKKGGKGDKGGKGEKGGQSRDPFKDDYSSSGMPSPVAIAVLRDDFTPTSELMYFRQTVLSSYNGHHLVGGLAEGWDADVMNEFPRSRVLRAPPVQNPADHTLVPTTMYLLVDHPQPLALGHPLQLAPAPNPNPQQFVAAYDAQSQLLTISPQRLLGRRSIPERWSPAERAHYLALPDDPRYAALSDIIARDVDPRFASDDLARAWAIKRYLEREGFYTMKSKHATAGDPTASFLFGSLRGYCVHFAHAATYLYRSQGIAARVALGYAVQTAKRPGGSSILIMSDRAHAWPEIYLDGIGWVTFDVYPERTDVPPPQPVDYDLEKLLGELARADKTAGVSAEGQPLRIPWAAIGLVAALALLAALCAGYLCKLERRLAPALARGPAYGRLAYRALLDRLAEVGRARRPGETRERHAARVVALCPSFEPMTRHHLAAALGGRAAERGELALLYRAARGELRRALPPARRALALLHPFAWLRTR